MCTALPPVNWALLAWPQCAHLPLQIGGPDQPVQGSPPRPNSGPLWRLTWLGHSVSRTGLSDPWGRHTGALVCMLTLWGAEKALARDQRVLCLSLDDWPAGRYEPSLTLSGPRWSHPCLYPPGHPTGGSSCPHLPPGEWVMQLGVSGSRSTSPKGRSEDDSYDDEVLSAIEGLSSTR
jgi:hypothetical protein